MVKHAEGCDGNCGDDHGGMIMIDFTQGFRSGSKKQELFMLLCKMSGSRFVGGAALHLEDYEELICAEFLRRYKAGELEGKKAAMFDANNLSAGPTEIEVPPTD